MRGSDALRAAVPRLRAAGVEEAPGDARLLLAHALGVAADLTPSTGIELADMGHLPFIFVVAPHHPLAAVEGKLSDAQLQPHRVVAVADSTQRGRSVSLGILPGQDVLTVPTMQHKLEAQLRGLGGGFLPLSLAQQRDKAMALGMMHDLQPPAPFKRRVRRWLQRALAGRARSPYGENEFFRKAVRRHELFWRL